MTIWYPVRQIQVFILRHLNAILHNVARTVRRGKFASGMSQCPWLLLRPTSISRSAGSFPRNLSVSGLSDNMRAPGINALYSVREHRESRSSSDAESSVVDETDSPSCDDLHPSLMMDSDGSYR